MTFPLSLFRDMVAKYSQVRGPIRGSVGVSNHARSEWGRRVTPMPRAGPRCSSATPLPPPSSPQTCRCGMGNPSWLSPYPVLTIEFWMVELELLLARNHEPSWEVTHINSRQVTWGRALRRPQKPLLLWVRLGGTSGFRFGRLALSLCPSLGHALWAESSSRLAVLS